MWGLLSPRLLRRLSPDYLNYDDVGELLLEVDLELTGGRYRADIISNFRWREIGLVRSGPAWPAPDEQRATRFRRARLTPGDQVYLPRMSYRERWEVARRCHMVPLASRAPELPPGIEGCSLRKVQVKIR